MFLSNRTTRDIMTFNSRHGLSLKWRSESFIDILYHCRNRESFCRQNVQHSQEVRSTHISRSIFLKTFWHLISKSLFCSFFSGSEPRINKKAFPSKANYPLGNRYGDSLSEQVWKSLASGCSPKCTCGSGRGVLCDLSYGDLLSWTDRETRLKTWPSRKLHRRTETKKI